MSHAEYVADLDEEQLESLIEHAKGRIEKIRASGWVRLWVVSTDDLNLGWFAENDYEAALDYLGKAGRERAQKGYPDGLEVRLERFRPDEAARLVKEPS